MFTSGASDLPEPPYSPREVPSGSTDGVSPDRGNAHHTSDRNNVRSRRQDQRPSRNPPGHNTVVSLDQFRTRLAADLDAYGVGVEAAGRVKSAAASLVDALAAFDPTGLSDEGLGDLVIDLDRAVTRVSAFQTEVLAEWNERGVWALDGARSGAGWMAARCGVSRSAVSGRLKVASALRHMTVTAESARAGLLTYDKVRLLVKAHKDLPAPFLRDESWLVDAVERLTVSQTMRYLAHWRLRADPEGAADRDAHAHERRGLHLSRQYDGTWKLDGTLEAESGEIAANAIAAIADELFHHERSLAAAEGNAVESTVTQRRADAFVELIRRGLGADPNNAASPTPTIVAFINARDLAGINLARGGRAGTNCSTGGLAGTNCSGGDLDGADCSGDDLAGTECSGDCRSGINRLGPIGETAAGTPLTAEAARRLACDAGISRVITDGSPTPVDLGMTQRHPSTAQRRALHARDRGCTFPGCDRPPGWTHAHHIRHWANDGPTEMSNMTLLCSHHHHLVHEGGFGLTRLADGHLRFTRPDGQPVTPAHDRADVDPHW